MYYRKRYFRKIKLKQSIKFFQGFNIVFQAKQKCTKISAAQNL